MKIIGIELRYRHPGGGTKEVAMFACDIPLPPIEDFAPRWEAREVNITVHTSEGGPVREPHPTC